ncbi:MAG: hypothetical protein NC084_03130 [Bacteroides sp.]|nr:hypothetical protein [Eubacterium sp.]MCM1417600.1 hypothetical protein [Roseburia sp.]MCM1461689.1 hypothetical protein [Bacteroides sp.]
MKSEIGEYKTALKNSLDAGDELTPVALKMLEKRIAFYQHERLVHLIVTMTFAVMTVLSFFMLALSGGLPALLLSLLFLGLTIPYVGHYYFLENSVQELYTLYYRAVEQKNERENFLRDL